MLKVILLAGAVAAPFAASAHAADFVPPAADPNNIGLYLRGDFGWSWLKQSGSPDDSTWAGGAGVGYRYSDNMRADITMDWSGKYDLGGGDGLSTSAVLGNVYYDLHNSTMFTPYVGLGAGYGWVNGTGAVTDKSGFAVGAKAGLSVDLTSNIAVDTGYQFQDIMVTGADVREHRVMTGLRFSF
ncbi:MAG: porin family protein [Hyphomicrobiales bacterium]